MKFPPQTAELLVLLSPPSRGAWIEILCSAMRTLCFESPPSRGAWIEITLWGGAAAPP